MAEAIEQRDFFISFNGADLAYAEAIDAALRAAGFTTFFHPNDLPPGGNIPLWMEDALMSSRQLLALCSPEYMADGAVYSEAERYARFWQDARGAEFKLVPVELKVTNFKPLMSVYKRIDVKGKTPNQAAAVVVAALKKSAEIEERKVIQSVERLPKIFNVLYRHNPNFTGRFEAMESLQKSLRDGNAAITAVAGMGGVGKTTLAAEYCHRFGGLYGGVWWVRAEQEPVMLADIAALGPRLGIAAAGNIEIDARATLESVANQKDQWLMVYDNAPNADAVSKWLPRNTVRCLITSRFTGFDDFATVTRLDQWSDEVTTDYLLARTKRDDKAGALRLAHSLGGLPLAAEQAAVFLKDRKGITFGDYVKEVARLIKEGKPAGAKGDYSDTAYAAVVKSLDTLAGMKGGKIALDVLRLCSFLSPDGVDLALLTSAGTDSFIPADFAAAMAAKFAREDAFAALISLSLLRQEDGPAGTVLIFHRLLLEVIRDWIGKDTGEAWGRIALELVNNAFPYEVYNPANWPLCARLMPHIAPLEMYAPRTSDAVRYLARLLNQGGIYLVHRGDRAGALVMLENVVTVETNIHPNDPANLAGALNNIAARYSELGRLDDAEATCKRVIEIATSHFPENDPHLAIAFSNLATVYHKKKAFPKAEELLIRAMKIMMAAHGPNSSEYGVSQSNLGALYEDWSNEPGQEMQRAKAPQYKSKALEITLAADGPRHPHTAIRQHNYAMMKNAQGDWAEASAHSERAVATMLSLDLPQHPDTEIFRTGLLIHWQHVGHLAKAAQLQTGDISPLLPVIAQIEAEQRAWVAEDPNSRHFGPPSPFADN